MTRVKEEPLYDPTRILQEQLVTEYLNEEVWIGYTNIYRWSGVPMRRVKEIIRNFKNRGIVRLVPLFDEDTNMLRGRGYILTDKGVGYRLAAMQALAAAPA